MSADHRRRSMDHGLAARAELWLMGETGVITRTVWLFIVTVVVLIAIFNAQDAANKIEKERAASIRRACVSQNARHDATIRQLDLEIEQLQATEPREAARAATQRTATVQLLNAIVPHQDCDLVLRETLHPSRHPSPVIVTVPTLPIPPILPPDHR